MNKCIFIPIYICKYTCVAIYKHIQTQTHPLYTYTYIHIHIHTKHKKKYANRKKNIHTH